MADIEIVQDLAVEQPSTVLIIPAGAKVLRTKCKKVKAITKSTKDFAQLMEAFLKVHQGDSPRPLGISAPQLGQSIRMFSYLTNTGNAEDITTVVNPELVYEKKLHFVKESCLSLPGRTFLLKRGKIVKIKGMSLDGTPRSFKGHGVLAQVFMHELNHLDGITIDMLPDVKRLA